MPSLRSAPSPRSASPSKTLVAPPSPSPRGVTSSPTKRSSLAPGPRKSLVRIPSGPASGRSPAPQTPVQDTPSNSPPSRRTSPPPRPPPAFQRASSPLAAPQPRAAPPRSPSPILAQQPPPSIAPAVDEAELQELRAKNRVLEIKRADDARRVRELETRLSEAESFVALRPKLQAKLQTQQTELIATRRELADAKQLAELAESRVLDAQELLEMATLDKEVAEERAEAAEIELEDVKERLAIAEVELEVLKEEAEDGGSGGGGGGRTDTDIKSSLAYIQLEKQNERLKEALMRLRDLSQETEQDQRRRISEMEKDVMGAEDVQGNHRFHWYIFGAHSDSPGQLEAALGKLSNAEAQVEDLKIQLDDALGAEEMLVQLTERNLLYSEVIPPHLSQIHYSRHCAENRGNAHHH